MLANEDDIIECYLAGLKKSKIIEYYKLTKPRLNRILKDRKPPEKPKSYNDDMIAPDLWDYICNYTRLADVMRLARQAGLNPNKMYDYRKNKKHEDINLITHVVFLLNAGVKITLMPKLDLYGDGGEFDISGLRKILKRHKVEIKAVPNNKIKMTSEQKEVLKRLYIKYNIAATFQNAVKITQYFNEFLTEFDVNDFISVLFKANWDINLDKFNKNLQFHTISNAMHEFEGYIRN